MLTGAMGAQVRRLWTVSLLLPPAGADGHGVRTIGVHGTAYSGKSSANMPQECLERENDELLHTGSLTPTVSPAAATAAAATTVAAIAAAATSPTVARHLTEPRVNVLLSLLENINEVARLLSI